MILYLDFDGVLHTSGVFVDEEGRARVPDEAASAGHALFQHAPFLEKQLEPYPDGRIVLGTTWAQDGGWRNAADLLPKRLS